MKESCRVPCDTNGFQRRGESKNRLGYRGGALVRIGITIALKGVRTRTVPDA